MAAQEQLPTSILRQFGLGRETMRVLMAREMIELYISYKNLKADYVDFNLKFKKALNLLGFAVMEEEVRRAVPPGSTSGRAPSSGTPGPTLTWTTRWSRCATPSSSGSWSSAVE